MSTADVYWDEIYRNRDHETLGWFEVEAATLVDLDALFAEGRAGDVIDVGSGVSRLVDRLLDRSRRVTLLDRSAEALAHTQSRLGPRSKRVDAIVADITQFLPERRWAIWHDRATFHFMTTEADRQAYVAAMAAGVEPGGHAVIATFAEDGPNSCAGLSVERYSCSTLAAVFEPSFALVRCRHIDGDAGVDACGDRRPYTVATLRRTGAGLQGSA